jgi:hypothetical protein
LGGRHGSKMAGGKCDLRITTYGIGPDGNKQHLFRRQTGVNMLLIIKAYSHPLRAPSPSSRSGCQHAYESISNFTFLEIILGKYILPLKHKHRSQPHCSLATTTHMHALGTHLLYELVSPWAIPGDESALSFASKILYVVRELRVKLLNLAIHMGADISGMRDEVVLGDEVIDCVEEEDAGWISYPRVVSAQFRQHFFTLHLRRESYCR